MPEVDFGGTDLNQVWGLFVADRLKSFPNFYPVGLYTSRDQAIEAMTPLPPGQSYQLFQLPIDHYFGFRNRRGELCMDSLPHWHFDDES